MNWTRYPTLISESLGDRLGEEHMHLYWRDFHKGLQAGESIFRSIIAKDCLLTLVKGRLALGSPGCSFVRSFVCHHAENGPIHRKMVVDCPLVIISKVKLFFRPDKTRKKE